MLTNSSAFRERNCSTEQEVPGEMTKEFIAFIPELEERKLMGDDASLLFCFPFSAFIGYSHLLPGLLPQGVCLAVVSVARTYRVDHLLRRFV